MSRHKFDMSEDQAVRVHQLASSHIQALKNWMVSAVEQGNLEGAQELAREIRAHQAIFAAFNMQAKHEVARFSHSPLQVNHFVEEQR